MMHDSKKCGGMRRCAWWLIVIGALNWGLVGLGGLFNRSWDVVYLLIGSWSSVISDLVYLVIGIAAVIVLVGCKKCEAGGGCADCKNGTCAVHGGEKKMEGQM